MREVNFTVFKFDELTTEVQDKVIERYRQKENFCWDWADSDMLTECFEYKAKEFGYDEAKVNWSLSSCQGDGVAIYGTIDFDKWIVNHEEDFTAKELKRLKWLHNEFGITIDINDNNHHYTHAYTMSAEVYADYYYEYAKTNLYDEVIDKLSECIESSIRGLSHKLENEGYEDINSRYEDEYIKEMLTDGEYEFYEDGKDF